MTTEIQPETRLKVSLLTGGADAHYALGLLSGLIPQRIAIDLIGNDEMINADAVKREGVMFYNLRGNQDPAVPLKRKIYRVFRYYLKLLKYAAETDSPLFHILWLNKFLIFDSTLLNVYYKLLNKKLVFTAHNINIRERDGKDTLINRLSLRLMYKLVDHIFVHTEKMKLKLVESYGVKEGKVTVIRFGINNVIPHSELTRPQARKELGLRDDEKVILFFGNIAPYKGLEFLLLALVYLKERISGFRLIIAGRITHCAEYWRYLASIIEKYDLTGDIVEKTEYIPDEEVEVYFKSADVLVLPYVKIFQSGVLFLSYSFGLPVIATDVGSLREEIIEGATGFTCKPGDSRDLAEKIRVYFESELFKNGHSARERIMEYARERYSWEKIGEETHFVYKRL